MISTTFGGQGKREGLCERPRRFHLELSYKYHGNNLGPACAH